MPSRLLSLSLRIGDRGLDFGEGRLKRLCDVHDPRSTMERCPRSTLSPSTPPRPECAIVPTRAACPSGKGVVLATPCSPVRFRPRPLSTLCVVVLFMGCQYHACCSGISATNPGQALDKNPLPYKRRVLVVPGRDPLEPSIPAWQHAKAAPGSGSLGGGPCCATGIPWGRLQQS